MNQIHSGDKGVSVGRDVVDSVIATGDNTTINQTFVQKVFNFFKPDTETLDQRNRRILLNHVDNFWVKGVLEKSLHGAAMLELGIKEDPAAVTYPWAIKKEETGETLPAGTSMLEIFEQIGMGRSLLILGAPGSGKTTMLLELARQLIERARQKADEPIPMVFNLASWTEKLSLADWLAQELNNIYYVPRKTAPDWVKGNKLLLLLDGLDEVQQESRAKCAEAINQFRKEHGLTSLAVCSRSQDYEELATKLAFDGVIEVQPLTQKQITAFFNRFGKDMAGLKSVLKKDSTLREMAETPLFLSIMVMAYRDKRNVEILISGDQKAKRKHLFDTYIKSMLEHPFMRKSNFKHQKILSWLSWIANKMMIHKQSTFLVKRIQPAWTNNKTRALYNFIVGYIVLQPFIALTFIMTDFILNWIINKPYLPGNQLMVRSSFYVATSVILAVRVLGKEEIQVQEFLIWGQDNIKDALLLGFLIGCIVGIIDGILVGIYAGFVVGIISFVFMGFNKREDDVFVKSKVRVVISERKPIVLLLGLLVGLLVGTSLAISESLVFDFRTSFLDGSIIGLVFGLLIWFSLGGLAEIQNKILLFVLGRKRSLPFNLVPFLDHCVGLIFLRHVGGGYIFIHRLLMEHFAAMYEEDDQRIGSG